MAAWNSKHNVNSAITIVYLIFVAPWWNRIRSISVVRLSQPVFYGLAVCWVDSTIQTWASAWLVLDQCVHQWLYIVCTRMRAEIYSTTHRVKWREKSVSSHHRHPGLLFVAAYLFLSSRLWSVDRWKSITTRPTSDSQWSNWQPWCHGRQEYRGETQGHQPQFFPIKHRARPQPKDTARVTFHTFSAMGYAFEDSHSQNTAILRLYSIGPRGEGPV